MIKKIACIGVIGLLFSSITSCEKDFTDVGSTIINNDKFTTKTMVFDVEITQKNVNSVNSGNTEIPALGEYLLGVYKKGNAKTIVASIVSQLTIPNKLNVSARELKTGEVLEPAHLDAVILKIPVQATASGSTFKIDSLLGNSAQSFNLNVYENRTYLNTLNPKNTAEKYVYLSNKKYDKKSEKLNLKSAVNFGNLPNDTMFVFDRKLSNGTFFKDTVKIVANKKGSPFMAIELDKKKLKEIIFDKYQKPELASQDAFNNYFRGVILEVTGNDGAMIPLNLANDKLKPSVDFIQTSTITKGGAIQDTIKTTHSFYLGGVRNSIYKMSENSTSLPNNVVLQGTAGSIASIKISESDLMKLRNKQVLINDAKLIFDVNTTVTDSLKTPKRLFLYKNEKQTSGSFVAKQLKDGLSKSLQGTLLLNDEKPDNYTFNVINHISDIIKGNSSNTELILRVYNSTDTPSSTSDVHVDDYNWNPRSVNLLSNSTENGEKRGVKLVISYTEKK